MFPKSKATLHPHNEHTPTLHDTPDSLTQTPNHNLFLPLHCAFVRVRAFLSVYLPTQKEVLLLRLWRLCGNCLYKRVKQPDGPYFRLSLYWTWRSARSSKNLMKAVVQQNGFASAGCCNDCANRQASKSLSVADIEKMLMSLCKM